MVKQLQTLSSLEDTIESGTLPDDEDRLEFSMYLNDDVKAVVADDSHWRWIKFLKGFVKMILSWLRSIEGNTGAGAVYYAFLMIKIYIDVRLKVITDTVDVPEDFVGDRREFMRYVKRNLPRGVGQAQANLTKFDFYWFAVKRLLVRWRLSFSELFLSAYFLDIRYVGQTEYLGKDYTLSQWMSLFLARFRSISTRRAVRCALTNFRSKSGSFAEEWTFYGDVSPDSEYTVSLQFWRTIKLCMKDDPTRYEGELIIAEEALSSVSAPSSNGQIERAMKAIKDQHTAVRSSLGVLKTRKLIYIQNNDKLLEQFEADRLTTNQNH